MERGIYIHCTMTVATAVDVLANLPLCGRLVCAMGYYYYDTE